MIAYLSGKIKHKGAKSVILAQSGVGREIFVNLALLEELKIDQEVEFFIGMVVRETAFELYGFKTIQELEIFKKLKAVSGVGPKTALAVLEIATPKGIITAVLNKESDVLSRASGIGKKTAERIILELKSRLKDQIPDHDLSKDRISDPDDEVATALINLGYSSREAIQAVESLPAEAKSIEDKIKAALNNLNIKI